jgi:hypothetical protein
MLLNVNECMELKVQTSSNGMIGISLELLWSVVVYAPSQAFFSCYVHDYMYSNRVTQLHTVPLVLLLFKFKQPTHFAAENELAKTSYHDFPNKHNIMIHNPVI